MSLHPAFDFEESTGGISAYRHRENGLQVLLCPLRAAPVATFMLTYRVGSRNEVAGLTGATHFLEHLMFKGTERFQKAKGTSVFQTLQRVGAQVNATTWLDRTNYFAVVPAEHLSLAVEIEADRMRGLLLREEDVASEKTVILNELDRGLNEPIRRLFQAVWAAAYVAHPYHHPTIGWRSDVEAVTPEGLRSFYDAFYWPDNATATFVGSFDEAEALALVDQQFGGIARAPKPWPEVVTREPEQRGERRVIVKQAAPLGTLMLGWKCPPATHPDADALAVLFMLLTHGRTSRLYRALTDAGRTTFVGGTSSRLRDPGLAFLYAQPTPGTSLDAVEGWLRAEVQRVRDEGVGDEELERARKGVEAQEAYARDGAYAVAGQLNESIAAGDWRLFATALQRVHAVTADDVQRVARTYLHDDALTVGLHLPA